MARKGLPAKYARMGFAKGWKAYKRSKGSSARRRSPSTRKISTRRSSPMARRKTYARRRKSSFLTPEIKGMIGAVLYDSLVSPMIPLNENTKNLVELGAGFMLRKKTGWIGATAKTLMILNGYAMLRGLIGDKLGGLTPKFELGGGF